MTIVGWLEISVWVLIAGIVAIAFLNYRVSDLLTKATAELDAIQTHGVPTITVSKRPDYTGWWEVTCRACGYRQSTNHHPRAMALAAEHFKAAHILTVVTPDEPAPIAPGTAEYGQNDD
jgi:hypothetical protein